MARLRESVVTLRIGGDDLVPEEITKLLGTAPTHAQTKGEKIVGKKTGTITIAKAGLWRLSAANREPEDMNGQIHEILSQTTNDLAVWKNITARYWVDLYCGLFLGVSNEGLVLSPVSLAALGKRGIELALDIYSGYDDDDDKSA